MKRLFLIYYPRECPKSNIFIVYWSIRHTCWLLGTQSWLLLRLNRLWPCYWKLQILKFHNVYSFSATISLFVAIHWGNTPIFFFFNHWKFIFNKLKKQSQNESVYLNLDVFCFCQYSHQLLLRKLYSPFWIAPLLLLTVEP